MNKRAFNFAYTDLRSKYKGELHPAPYNSIVRSLRLSRDDFIQYFRMPAPSGTLNDHLRNKLVERFDAGIFHRPNDALFSKLVDDFLNAYLRVFPTMDPTLIAILDADTSKKTLERLTPLRKLPNGLRPLRSITEGKTFRKFLEEGALKFFSREAFNREMRFDEQARLEEEQSILSTLLEGNDQLGLVLSGPRGVGKTRLAFQLGLDAENKDNWRVWRVERDICPEAIEELEREYASPAQVLLIID